jgi:hypothetical protein
MLTRLLRHSLYRLHCRGRGQHPVASLGITFDGIASYGVISSGLVTTDVPSTERFVAVHHEL